MCLCIGGGGHVGVNIDPVATDAGSASSGCSKHTNARLRLRSAASPPSPPSPTRPLWERYNCWEWAAHLFPETGAPPGSPCLFTSVSPTAVITALVFLLCCRQKALMGGARLQIPVLTFLIKSALSSRFILLHPSIHLAQCSHLRG